MLPGSHAVFLSLRNDYDLRVLSEVGVAMASAKEVIDKNIALRVVPCVEQVDVGMMGILFSH